MQPVQTPSATQAAGPATAGNVYQVTIKNFAFDPATINIKKGDSVKWTNEDSAPHTVTGPGFDSGTLNTGKTYSYTFNVAGSFDYQCNLHPRMKGTITVQ